MNFKALLEQVIDETTQKSLGLFAPELAICTTIVLLLLARIVSGKRSFASGWLALLGTIVGLGLAGWQFVQIHEPGAAASEFFFTGLLVYDKFTVFFRFFLLLFLVLVVVLTMLSGIPDNEDGPDFYTLLLGSTIGMMLMASANHLLMLFFGIEMTSVPSYAMVGFLKGRRLSSEAALKYVVYGAGAAGVMLYGISLLAGVLGSAHLPTMAKQLSAMLASEQGLGDFSTALTLGGLMVMVGLAFKLSVVPFHFWCPDVFEGATAEVNAFLSVASKAGALAMLVRLVVGLGHVGAAPTELAAAPAAVERPASDVAQQPPVASGITQATKDLNPVRKYMLGLLCLLSAVTCTFGNLAAYGQTNIKRLLAYSTIAHAGYLLMPVTAVVVLMGQNSALAENAAAAVCFYIGIYLFMNLGAFAIVAFLRNVLHSEEIADYAGLIRRMPALVICFAMLLLSLLGLPPLAGFPAKVVIFSSLIDAAQADPEAWTEMIGLLVIGGLNTAISLFYYLRVVKVMIIDPEPADRLPVEFPMVSPRGAYLAVVVLPVLLLGIWWDGLNQLARAATSQLFS